MDPVIPLFKSQLNNLKIEEIPKILDIILSFVSNITSNFINTPDYQQLYYKIFSYFPLFIDPTYYDYENIYLTKKLNTLLLPDSNQIKIYVNEDSSYIENVMNEIDNLPNIVSDYFKSVKESINRSFISFDGLFICDLIKILNNNINVFLSSFNEIVSTVKDLAFLPDNTKYQDDYISVYYNYILVIYFIN